METVCGRGRAGHMTGTYTGAPLRAPFRQGRGENFSRASHPATDRIRAIRHALLRNRSAAGGRVRSAAREGRASGGVCRRRDPLSERFSHILPALCAGYDSYNGRVLSRSLHPVREQGASTGGGGPVSGRDPRVGGSRPSQSRPAFADASHGGLRAEHSCMIAA